MNNKSIILLLIAGFVCFVNGTEVKQCTEGNARRLTSDEVSISACTGKGRCKLRRTTSASVEIKFTAEENIKSLITNIHANIARADIPFYGVNGVSACESIYLADGKTKTECPLKAHETYIYKTSFPILEIYPKINLEIHFALQHKDKDVVCFEIPAKII